MVKYKSLTIIVVSALLLFSCKSGLSEFGSSSCPKLQDLQKTIDSIQKGISLEKVEKSPIVGLCEVIVKISEGERALFYTDAKGKFIVSGNIIEIATRKNLTSERLAFLNKRVLNPEALKELEGVVAFTWGKSDKYIYFITDPDCPFCKQAETILEEMVNSGKIAVKVILYPLEPIHPEAKTKSISIICDNKGYEGLKKGYLSKNQCDQGKTKIELSISLMQKLNVKGTPTFVFPDGEIRSGVLPASFILSKLGVK